MRKPFASRVARALRNFLTDGSYRGMVRQRLFGRDTMFQSASVTRANRYPVIFAFVQSQLGVDFEGRILSFGCSTGEEVMTLRAYFPRAFIKGIDINPANIAAFRKALARMPDPKIAAECAGSTQGEDDSSYDAIFCMAVLRDGGLSAANVADCSRLFPFSRFAESVGDLARCLKPGGLLILRFSNFRLCDAPAGDSFDTLLRRPYANAHFTPLFGPDNRRLADSIYEDTVFRKKPAASVP